MRSIPLIRLVDLLHQIYAQRPRDVRRNAGQVAPQPPRTWTDRPDSAANGTLLPVCPEPDFSVPAGSSVFQAGFQHADQRQRLIGRERLLDPDLLIFLDVVLAIA